MGDIRVTITAFPTATSSPTSTVTPTGSSSDSPHPSYWDTHKRWLIMVIVLGIGLILFAIAAWQLTRYLERKQDKITSGFNAGITQGSQPMTQSRDPLMYSNNSAKDSRQHPLNAPLQSETSLQYPPRIRERDMRYIPSMQHVSSNDSGKDVNLAEEGTTVRDWEGGRGKLNKGKGRTMDV